MNFFRHHTSPIEFKHPLLNPNVNSNKHASNVLKLIIYTVFPNLQILLSDEKCVHEASAHQRVEGLLQAAEQLQILLLVGSNQSLHLVPIGNPFTDPREQVIQLLENT